MSISLFRPINPPNKSGVHHDGPQRKSFLEASIPYSCPYLKKKQLCGYIMMVPVILNLVFIYGRISIYRGIFGPRIQSERGGNIHRRSIFSLQHARYVQLSPLLLMRSPRRQRRSVHKLRGQKFANTEVRISSLFRPNNLKKN